jgi:hypothetical protein
LIEEQRRGRFDKGRLGMRSGRTGERGMVT